MAAHIVESTQLVAVADDDDGLAGEIGRQLGAVFARAVGTAHQLPRAGEHCAGLGGQHGRVRVDGGRWCGGPADIFVDVKHGISV